MALFDGLDGGPNIFTGIVPEADQPPSLSYLKQLLFSTEDPEEKQKIAELIQAQGGNTGPQVAFNGSSAPQPDGVLHFSGTFQEYDKFADASSEGKKAVWDGPPPSGTPTYMLTQPTSSATPPTPTITTTAVKPDGSSITPSAGDTAPINAAPDPRASAPAAPNLASAREAIAYIESRGSGDYNAVGPQTKSGDRAYGRYQVMGANIPSWTKAALGYTMTPEQFMRDPQAQDTVFNHRFGSYVYKYGNMQDAASAWFTGRPLAQGANARDILGTSGSKYVNMFNNALGLSSSSNSTPTPSTKASPNMADTPDNSSPGFGDKLSGLFNDPMFLAGMQILSNSMVKRPLTAQISPFQGVPELLAAAGKTKLEQDKLKAQQLVDAKAGNLLSLDSPSSPTAPTPAIPAPSAPVSTAGGLGGLGGIPASNIVPETPVGQMAPDVPLPPVRPDDLPTATPTTPAPAKVPATPVTFPDVIQGPFGPKTSAWVQAKQQDALSVVGNSNNSDARRKQASDMLQMLSKYSDQSQQPTELKLWQSYKQNGGKLDFPTFLDRNQSEKDADKLQIHVTGQDPNTGAPVYSTFNPKTGEVKPLAAPAGTAPTDGRDPNLTGDAFLQTLPFDRQNQIKAMVEGRQPPISSFALSKPANKQLLADANQYDPTFDASNWASRSAANKEFHAGGPSSPAAQITAGNTAIQHLGHLVDLADKLNNGSFTPWNSVANSVSSAVGDNTAVKSFNTVRDLAAAEITKFYKGTVNKSDMEEVQKNISSSNTPAQLAETIKAQVDAMNAKINALQDRWHNAMGPNVKDFEIIQPESQAAIKKINAFADNGGKMPDEYRQGANPASAAKQTNTTQPSQKQPTVSGNVFGLKWGVSP